MNQSKLWKEQFEAETKVFRKLNAFAFGEEYGFEEAGKMYTEEKEWLEANKHRNFMDDLKHELLTELANISKKIK